MKVHTADGSLDCSAGKSAGTLGKLDGVVGKVLAMLSSLAVLLLALIVFFSYRTSLASTQQQVPPFIFERQWLAPA